MPSANPYERWEVKLPGKVKYELSRDITWADIKSCMVELSRNGGGNLDDGFVAGSKDGDTFAPLHRANGGLMCVSGPGFLTNELWEAGPGHRHGQGGMWEGGNYPVRKAIRFNWGRPSWGSSCNWDRVFLDTCEDDTVLLKCQYTGSDTISLRFEGQGCKAWTKRECREYADIIANVLHLC